MATLAELRTRILNKLDDGNVQHPTASQVDEQINLTIDYYETEEFWFTEEIVTLTTTVGDGILSGIPSDFKQLIMPNSLVVFQSQVPYPVKKITPLQFDSIFVGNSLGLPRWFTYRDGNIELYYTPDQVYNVELFYRKTYADLVNDNDQNDFTTKTERLIEYKTLLDLLDDYRVDLERVARYEAKVNDEYKKIKRESVNRITTGELITENIVDRDRAYTYFGY